MSDLRIRLAVWGFADVSAIYHLLTNMFDEATMPLEPLDEVKASQEIARVLKEEVAWIVEDEGKIVATAGLTKAGFWFSKEPHLVQRWLYALPEHRGENGAWGLIRDEISKFCDDTRYPVYIDVMNPQKLHRKESRISAPWVRFSYYPRGLRLQFNPAKEEAA